ncbi:hypothetical protein PISMIDRAFT_268769 [Pisolithus microcarpus 441]|uniref:Uncharacterized protein n=1 Tax=Pisolithus microcarpus 441 TaxID=765257 RepID=A0A0C9YR42_9AGAM|nr:hypothetical protein PISMIDRAFT_268769 [Pisolithus microcarpus 441]
MERRRYGDARNFRLIVRGHHSNIKLSIEVVNLTIARSRASVPNVDCSTTEASYRSYVTNVPTYSTVYSMRMLTSYQRVQRLGL